MVAAPAYPNTVAVRPRRRRLARTLRPDFVLLRWRKPLTRRFFSLELRMLIFIVSLSSSPLSLHDKGAHYSKELEIQSVNPFRLQIRAPAVR